MEQESRSAVINGRLHVEGKDGLYHFMPISADEARLKDEKPSWLVEFSTSVAGKIDNLYKAVDVKAYVQKRIDDGFMVHTANKNDNVIIRPTKDEGELLSNVYREDLLTKKDKFAEVATTKRGDYVITAADADGSVIINDVGNPKRTIVSEERLRRDYDVPEQITAGTFAQSRLMNQRFIHVPEDIAIKTANGKYVGVKKGDFLNITDMDNPYAITQSQFKEYEVINTSVKMPDGHVMTDESEDNTYQGDEMQAGM